MTEITNELIYETLKAIQARLDGMGKSLRDLAHGQIRLREDMNNLHGDMIRLEVQVIDVSTRLERVEKRSESVDIN